MRRLLACLALLLVVSGCGNATAPLSESEQVAAIRVSSPSPVVVEVPAPSSPTPQPEEPVVAAPVPVQRVVTPRVVGQPHSEVIARLVDAWPGDDAKMLSVVRCETGGTFNPYIRSRSGKYWGLFQADPDFRRSYGWSGWEVEAQVAMAWRGFQARGWRPWSCA